MSEHLPKYGKPTAEESLLTRFLMDGIAHYIADKPTDRRVLIAALCQICMIIFCQETRFDVKQQCEEIDDFCNFLKSFAMRNAKRS